MKKLLALVTALVFLGSGFAAAHQPVVLLNSDTTAAKGPLLVDGTVSFAVRAAFKKAGEKKAFRAQLKEGDALEVQYLIVDKKPENALKNSLFGDSHAHGTEGVHFFTRGKVITSRWLDPSHGGINLGFPQND